MSGSDERARQALRRRLAELESMPAIDKLRSFLRGHFSDADSMQEVQQDIRSGLTAGYAAPLRRELEALERVLNDALPPGTLQRLVAWDANWVIDDTSDVGARKWLEELAAFLRQELREHSGENHQ